MGLRLDDLYYFSISTLLEYVDAYTTLKGNNMKELNNRQTIYEGADGLDKFLGG